MDRDWKKLEVGGFFFGLLSCPAPERLVKPTASGTGLVGAAESPNAQRPLYPRSGSDVPEIAAMPFR